MKIKEKCLKCGFSLHKTGNRFYTEETSVSKERGYVRRSVGIYECGSCGNIWDEAELIKGR